MRTLRFALLLAAVVLPAACRFGGSSSPATPTIAPTPTPPPSSRYEREPCLFDVPAGETAACGLLTVPVSHYKDRDGTILLAVAVFKSHSATPEPDPIVYLDGGPGASSLKTVEVAFNDFFAPYLADRDLVLFDQRGIGYSEPALDCPEVTDAEETALRDTEGLEDLDLLYSDAYTHCHDRLVGLGIELATFNSKESAADLNDLRQALGYEAWNVYGVSYGTKLALTYMRDFPQGIRSVVLDSTYPLQSDLAAEGVPNADRALDTLFAACEAHAVCHEAYPNLERTFYDTVRLLDDAPATTEVLDAETGAPLFEATIFGGDILNAIFQGLYSTYTIPYLPRAISLAADGDYEFVGSLLGQSLYQDKFFSTGMYVSVQCHDEIAFTSREAVADAAEPYPDLADFAEDESTFQVCDLWDAGEADDEENRLVRSGIPTLVLAGSFDPITPPSWGRLVADDLVNSYFFEFPGVGHGTISDDECPLGIMRAFLSRPSAPPDDSCIAGMEPPDFVID